MKNWKDILQGVAGLFVLAGGMAWGYIEHRWKTATDTQKSIVLAVLIVVVALSIGGVARAENAPGSNFGVVRSLNEPGTAYACYLADGGADMAPGIVHTCLVLRAMGPGILATFGEVTFCTQTGMYQGEPAWSCGKYNDMSRLIIGI